MERNDDNLGNLGSSTNAGEGGMSGSAGSQGLGSTGGSGFGNAGDLTGSAGYGTTGAGYGATAGTTPGSTADAGISYGTGSQSQQESEGLKDRARTMASDAGERLSGAGSALRDRAGTAKNSLADMLEAGAKRLGSQGGSQQLAGATGTGSVTADGNRLSAVAGGLQSSADWLREADLDGMRTGIENQVRTNPGRSLLIAVGVGYLLGKALRK